MIAPLREMPSNETENKPRLSEAARAAVSALLMRPDSAEDAAPPVPAWQAWLLVAWLVAASSAYVAITLGLWI
jgi:hypothetical protein